MIPCRIHPSTKEKHMNTSQTFPSQSNQNSVGNAADIAHQAVDSANAKVTPALERVTNAAHRGIDKAVDVAAPAAAWVADSGRQLTDKSNELMEVCGSYVRARPLATVAGALAVGYIVGKLMRR
jgi:ElaB/YqjD/DUF883 family membrane-anchored ribosome-binding protein